MATSCARTPGQSTVPGVAAGLGPGPVWPVGFGVDGSQAIASSYSGGFYRIKVLWVADKQYPGPILVRGEQLDSPGVIQFSLSGGSDDEPKSELRFPASTGSSVRTWPSLVLVRGPGCYAFQIDGHDFSIVTIFAITS